MRSEKAKEEGRDRFKEESEQAHVSQYDLGQWLL